MNKLAQIFVQSFMHNDTCIIGDSIIIKVYVYSQTAWYTYMYYVLCYL